MKFAIQIILIYISILYFTVELLAQDKLYTKGLPNGFAWTAPLTLSKNVYGKEESLIESVQQRISRSKIDSSYNNKTFPLNCDEYVNKLSSENVTIDIKEITKQIDVFYLNKENLVIPVLGAYCYCVKKLVGVDAEELENYRQKLLQYSKDEPPN